MPAMSLLVPNPGLEPPTFGSETAREFKTVKGSETVHIQIIWPTIKRKNALEYLGPVTPTNPKAHKLEKVRADVIEQRVTSHFEDTKQEKSY